jgi:hypothetical protein
MSSFSHAALSSYIRKIHLVPGDVLVVSNLKVLEQLQKMPAMDFQVPVIFSPDGSGVERITREQLMETLERIDEAEAASQGIR